MRQYTNVGVNISQGQSDKIKKAMQGGASVNIRLSHLGANIFTSK